MDITIDLLKLAALCGILTVTTLSFRAGSDWLSRVHERKRNR